MFRVAVLWAQPLILNFYVHDTQCESRVRKLVQEMAHTIAFYSFLYGILYIFMYAIYYGCKSSLTSIDGNFMSPDVLCKTGFLYENALS